MSVAESKFQNCKTVVGSSERDLEKKVKYHKSKGWTKVGKIVEIHGIYKSEYIQVMEFGKLVNAPNAKM